MSSLLRCLFAYRWRILAGLLLLAAVDALAMSLPQLVGHVVDGLAAGKVGVPPATAAAWIVAITVFMTVLRFGWRWCLFGAARRLRRDLRVRLHDHLLTLSAPFYARNPTGELMAVVTNDLDAVVMACGFGVMAAFDALFLALFACTALALIDVRLTAVALAPLPLIALFVLVAGRAIHRRFERVQEQFGRLTENVREAVAGVRVVKSYAREADFSEAFARVDDATVRANRRLIGLSSSFDPVIAALSGVAMAAVLWWGGRTVMAGTLSVGGFVAVTSYLALMTWPMMAIGWVVNLVQRGAASMARIDRILAERPDTADAPDAHAFPDDTSVAFTRLTFRYPGANRDALTDLSVYVPDGRMLGVVGRTGAGKSTLALLLTRIHEPPPGTLAIGCVDVRALRLRELRRAVAVVPQEPLLFGLSVRENLAFARPDADDATIENAAKIAAIHDEINAFPDGYATVVGERGVTLSGGQKQRIAIARALLAEPRILVLDDCLSAVDVRTEGAILGQLASATAGRTTIVISHRLAAVEHADEILVLDDGHVVQRGTHAELLHADGLYARLAAWQRQEARVDE